MKRTIAIRRSNTWAPFRSPNIASLAFAGAFLASTALAQTFDFALPDNQPPPPPAPCVAALSACQGSCMGTFTQCVAAAGNQVTPDCQGPLDECNAACTADGGGCAAGQS